MKKHCIFWNLLCVISLGIFNGCSKEKTFDCVKSTGDIKKENRYFDNFSSLFVEDNINVILLQDQPGKVILEAGDNLLPKITCEQNGTRLTVRNNNTCNWVRSYKKSVTIYVGVNQVKQISQTGYGTITGGEYLRTDTLKIYNLTFGETDLTIDANYIGFIADDHGTLKLKGNAHKLAGQCYRNALVNTEEMNTPWIYIINKSIVNAQVYSDSLIQAQILGNGNILCKGNPPLVEYNHSSGNGALLFP